MEEGWICQLCGKYEESTQEPGLGQDCPSPKSINGMHSWVNVNTIPETYQVTVNDSIIGGSSNTIGSSNDTIGPRTASIMYTYQYYNDDGTLIQECTHIYTGTDPDEPSNPVSGINPKYLFIGWEEVIDGLTIIRTAKYDTSVEVSSGVTYKITYVNDNGDPLGPTKTCMNTYPSVLTDTNKPFVIPISSKDASALFCGWIDIIGDKSTSSVKIISRTAVYDYASTRTTIIPDLKVLTETDISNTFGYSAYHALKCVDYSYVRIYGVSLKEDDYVHSPDVYKCYDNTGLRRKVLFCDMIRPYNIAFSPNGGRFNSSTGSTTRTFYSGQKYAAYSDGGDKPSPIPTRTGYTFKAWYSASSGGSAIFDGDGYVNQTSGWFRKMLSTDRQYVCQLTSNKTVWAHWTANIYTVTFDKSATAASISITSQSVTYGQPYGTLPSVTRFGYEFAGWYSSSGQKVTSSTIANIASDHTLTAHWTPLEGTVLD